jgi:glycosyltransferase involved in cell wall biosynthesis
MSVSVIVLCKDSALTLQQALDAVNWTGEVIVVDNGSIDETVQIAIKAGARVVVSNEQSFARLREIGLSQAKHDWVFYLDADEVVTSELKQEIEQIVQANIPGVYRVKRKNNFLGTNMYEDQVERLFHRSLLKGWRGDVHETPVYEGEVNLLNNPLSHYTHTDIASMLAKTNEWSETEADLRIKAKHPPMKWWRFVSVAVRVWWDQLVHKKVWKYGRAGWFEGYFQMVDKLIVYTKLWERQN